MEENIQPAATPGSKKSLWYIIGIIIVVLIVGKIAWGMFGKSAMERAYESATGVDVDYNGNGSATYSTSEGTATIGANSLPESWPKDAPKYPGATIQFSASSNPETGKPGAAVVFQTSDSAEKVTDFYKRELASNGWTIEGTATFGVATTIAANKGDRQIGIQIADAGNGTTQVTVGIEMP